MAMANAGDVVPIPDPTRLTTQQLERATQELERLISLKVYTLKVRLDGMEKAADLDRQVSDKRTDATLHQATLLFMEKLVGVESSIKARDVALSAALQAAKEQAFERMSSTGKSIDQLNELMKTTTGAINAKVDENRERITMMESRSKGGSDVWAWIAIAVGALWGLTTTIELITHWHM